VPVLYHTGYESMNKRAVKIERRIDQYVQKAATRIWKEIPSSSNPYVTQRCLCHGYDLLDLMRQRSYADMIYLLMRGELPSDNQRKLLEALMVGLCNPGPRHPATRAAMNAGVGKTDTAHILPIALSIMGGAHLGGSEVQASMRFMRRHIRRSPQAVANELLESVPSQEHGDVHIAPGFGTRYGDVDIMSEQLISVLVPLNSAGKVLKWGSVLVNQLHNYDFGWLITGIAAAVFLDLGFHPRAGAGLFQLLSAPGLLAHGLEFVNKPITAMPFIEQDHYLITE
jgi:citrate synthase